MMFQSWDLHQVKLQVVKTNVLFIVCFRSYQDVLRPSSDFFFLLCVSQAPAPEKGGASAGKEKYGTTKEVGQSIFLAQLEVQF